MKDGKDYIDKKENGIFLIFKEIQMGSVAQSYMRKGFLIYEEMRKYFPIYEEAFGRILYDPRSLLISLYMRKNFIFFFQCSQNSAAHDIRGFLHIR